MSDAERLEQLAALYAEHPDAVPEGITIVTMPSGPCVVIPGLRQIALDATTPWFLTLALGALREKLEAKRRLVVQDQGERCYVQWGRVPGKTHENKAAGLIAAYRLMKETAHAD